MDHIRDDPGFQDRIAGITRRRWLEKGGRAARKMRVRRGQAATSSGLELSKLTDKNHLDRLGRYAVALVRAAGPELPMQTSASEPQPDRHEALTACPSSAPDLR